MSDWRMNTCIHGYCRDNKEGMNGDKSLATEYTGPGGNLWGLLRQAGPVVREQYEPHFLSTHSLTLDFLPLSALQLL